MHTISVLIVDDDQALSKALETKFSKLSGYNTTVASDGEEAIALLNAELFDVILLDLHMPKKNGVEVLKSKKKTKNADTPAYVITNLGSEKYCEEAVENGAKECFVKSRITLSEIVDLINQALKV
ncbi:MAG: response regulator [Candidatus Peregrinibacteria bacterium]|nr:response regulator [Candidatus Peregrinibacteria bacterium]MCB9807680.1 response regulator [Candidatus Peribacteria bacterium]